MNRFGAYTKLLANGEAALSAAIEIYNKPKIDYRNETFVILLVNAWELTLKAVLGRNKVPIYYNKQRNQPYRTLSVDDSIVKAETFFPNHVDFESVKENLYLLCSYRDTAIHFYNHPEVSVLIYGLAQASVLNLCDLVRGVFSKNLTEEFTLKLLPLSWDMPTDPVTFIKHYLGSEKVNPLTIMVEKIAENIGELEKKHADTSRLITHVTVALQSTKKISTADLVLGIQGEGKKVLVHKNVDPNKSHPFRQGDIVTSRQNPKDKPGKGISWGADLILTSHVFQKLVNHFCWKQDPKLCWMDQSGSVTRYSSLLIQKIRELDKDIVRKVLEMKN